MDYTTIFDNLEECKRFLEETRGITTFLVIFSSRRIEFATHHLKNIRSIYVYIQNNKRPTADQ
jgi:hypothetical protein